MEKAIKKYWPIFLLPTVCAFIIGFVIPFCQGLYLSLCKFQTVNKTTFVGLSNYGKAIADTLFQESFWLTVRFTLISTPVSYTHLDVYKRQAYGTRTCCR